MKEAEQTLLISMPVLLFSRIFIVGVAALFQELSTASENVGIGVGIYTPYTFPSPDSLHCSKNYLTLQFVCDPDHLLSYTEAKKIDKIFNYDKFSACPSSPMDNGDDENRYVVGLALASTMHLQNESIFSNGCQQQMSPHANHFDANKRAATKVDKTLIEKILNDIANVLFSRWSSPILPNNYNGDNNFDNKNYKCSYDILIIITHTLIICYDGERTVIDDKPLIGIGYSPRLRRTLSVSRRPSLGELKPTRDGSFLSLISDSLQTLDRLLPYVWDDANASGDRDDAFSPFKTANNSGHRNEINSGKSKRHAPHVPTWALIVFLVCLTLTFVCTVLGHWVNTGDSRGRFTSADGSLFFARGHSNDRRWRAGFAGGMMDARNPGGAGRGGGKAKGKMFGAMAMGNKKTNSAQYNYQRV